MENDHLGTPEAVCVDKAWIADFFVKKDKSAFYCSLMSA